MRGRRRQYAVVKRTLAASHSFVTTWELPSLARSAQFQSVSCDFEMGQKLGKDREEVDSKLELNGRVGHGIVVRMESPTPPSLPESPLGGQTTKSLKCVSPPASLAVKRRQTVDVTPILPPYRLSPLISLRSDDKEDEEGESDTHLSQHDFIPRKSKSLSGSPNINTLHLSVRDTRRRISEVTPAVRRMSQLQFVNLAKVNLTVSAYQIVALQQGWAAARAKGFGQPAHSVFVKFATQSHEVQKILEQRAKNNESLMTVHVKAFLDLMDFCLEHLHDEQQIRASLLLVGQRHSHFRTAGFKPKFWDQLAEVLVAETLRWRPKRGRNLETQAWTNVVLYMIGTMNEGYEVEKIQMRDINEHF